MICPPFILASASPRRVQLLSQIGLAAGRIIPADIDESPLKAELPAVYARRIAAAKAQAVAAQHPDAVVLAADTVVACGRRILPKAEDERSARYCLSLLSGRRHRVYTAVCVMQGGRVRECLVMTQVRFARLDKAQQERYIATGQWQGKAGGYAIQGAAETFIEWISGSFSNVVGLPLAQTSRLLAEYGIKGEGL